MPPIHWSENNVDGSTMIADRRRASTRVEIYKQAWIVDTKHARKNEQSKLGKHKQHQILSTSQRVELE